MNYKDMKLAFTILLAILAGLVILSFFLDSFLPKTQSERAYPRPAAGKEESSREAETPSDFTGPNTRPFVVGPSETPPEY